MNCESCKHWDPFKASKHQTDHVADANGLGLCRKVNGLNSYWKRDEDGLPDEPETGVLAAVEDLSDHAFLRTAAKFGCVMWEAK